MIVNSFKFREEDIILLNSFMKDNNIKNKSIAVRECIKRCANKKSVDDMLLNIDIKINRLIYNQNLIKKLLEQFFANTGFAENIKVDKDNCLKEFYILNNNYKDNFLG